MDPDLCLDFGFGFHFGLCRLRGRQRSTSTVSLKPISNYSYSNYYSYLNSWLLSHVDVFSTRTWRR